MKTKLSFECPICEKNHFVEVDNEKYIEYLKGTLVQDALPYPYLTAVQREQIISGLCPDCQKKIFG